MIKILIGGSPCTHWSIAQKNNRETEPSSGLGWELFKNFLIAKEKYKPDYFLYENNKSASQGIKNEIAKQLGVGTDENVRFTYINSALVSAQNRQRFYVTNFGDIKQPEDRGILLKDILESGESLTGNGKSYALTATYNGAVAWNTIERNRREMCIEPVGIGYRGRMDDGKWVKQYESNGTQKANALTTAQTDSMVAEPLNITSDGKAITLKAQYYKNGTANLLNDNSKGGKYAASGVAEPVRVGDLPNDKGEISGSQATRIYDIDGKSVNLVANGGGQGAKTGLYAVPVKVGEIENGGQGNRIYSVDGKRVAQTANSGGIGSNTGLYAVPVETDVICYAVPCEWDADGKPIKAISKADGKTYTVYEVKSGFITIKGKQYPIKLADGFYIIRKLIVKECMRLQTVPEWYKFPVSDSQAYKMLGNGWTVEVIKHLLSHIPNIENEEIEILSMYDGMSCGQIAFKEMGCNVVKYYATEIDKYAIQTTQENFPNTIQLGDAFQVREEGWNLWP